MLSFFLWYIVISLTGLAVFPLAYRLLPALSDRGYTLSRALGLLLWGYLFWLMGSLHILRNDLGGQLFALVLVVLASWLALRKITLEELTQWLSTRRSLVITVEVLFLLAFASLSLVRAANPEIFGTEKPMELAFINAILRSPAFPPNDPWLSGYGISYYYFGYVLVAMLARLTAVPGSVAFNLGISLIFALTAIGAYGLVYNLLSARSKEEPPGDEKHGSRLYYALLGPLFILLVSNLEGFLEVLHQLGVFWKSGPDGQLTSHFWTWLGILDLNQPPVPPFTWLPRLFGAGGWWWWRASRVIQDYDFANRWREIIDEFPAFSYLLADLHPHVLAMPFFLLAAALALNLFLGGSRGKMRLFSLELDLNLEGFGLAAFALGSLAFMNTWDILPTIALFAGAYAAGRMKALNISGLSENRPDITGDSEVDAGVEPDNGEQDENNDDEEEISQPGRPVIWLVTDFLSMAITLGIASLVLYLPFFLGFSSQAGGPMPNLVYITRGAQMWVMFASLWLPMGAFLLYLWFSQKKAGSLLKGALLAAGLMLVSWLLSLLLALLIPRLSFLQSLNPLANQAGTIFLNDLGAPSWPALFTESLVRRAVNNGGWITLFVLLALILGLFFRRAARAQEAGERHNSASPASWSLASWPLASWPLASSHLFVLLLALLGAVLVLAPEFVFLRDQFGYRINTIFKFYFQAWLLWGIVAAYGTAVLLLKLRRVWGAVFRMGLLALMVMALTYPVLGFWDKTHGFNPSGGLTLDGGAYIQRGAPDEWAAIQWLQEAPSGVIVEAIGDDYSDYARISEYSGQPAVLGWVGHEVQWRGGATEMGSRQADIEQLYTTNEWNTAQTILKKYNIRYVVIGSRERSTYHVNETKLKRYLTPVFQQGDVVIYEY
jgi:YYY domain-containing protein